MENDPHESAWLEAEAAAMEEDPVTVSLGPMGSLFRQLRSAIAWQYSRLEGVQAEIEILGEGIEGLCTDLKDLSEAEDTISMCWVRQVRDLCYDTSDYLDELKHFIHSSRARPRTKRPSPKNRLGSKIFRVSRRPACTQLQLSLRKVKKLKRVALIAKLSALVVRVEDADERRNRFKISPPQVSSKNVYPQAAGVSYLMPQLPLQLHVDKLVKLLGFDHDHGHDERNLKVATIFGSAGVGKTAVARTLYHKFRGRFQYRAFLRVSRDPDMRRLFHNLLSQIKAPPAHAFPDVQGLIAAITKHLLGKSYFIVIDDLWETSTWDIISQALPDGDHYRIITTTQIEDAALACCSDQLNHIYEINPLNDDKSGLSEDGLTAYHSTEEMKKTLNRVYNNLPPYLKTCLLYLNIYPEGWTVKKCELVKQWVAEGFIRSVQGQDPEETAGFYFDTLVTRGLVESVDTNHKDEVLSCTLHHMVLDLIRYKSLEENFVTIVNYFQTIIGLPDKVRRLSVQLGGAKGANNISGNMRISQVRSLIFCGYFKSVPSIIEYGLLQVLILHIWSDQDSIFDLTTIGQLYRLRYLKIKCSITVKLPHKIRRLQQLGTLHVDARLYVVPSDIVHLEKLLHLRLPSDSILPHGVGQMTRLRTLGSFDLSCNSEDNVRDLGELENLQDLQLTCSAVQAECLEKNVQLILGSVLKKLSMLQSVTLVRAAGSSNVNTQQDGAGDSSMSISCDSSSSVFPAPAHLRRLEFSRRCCILSRFPNWLGDLAQLCILKIAVGELFKEDIVILNGLPALASLSLHVATSSIEKIVFAKEGFTVLRYFKLTCTAPWLEFEAGAMPNLEKLKLCFNSPIVDEQGTTRTIIIGRLLGLKEFSAIIGSGIDTESAWWKAIRNDPRNPEVELTGMIYYGDKDRGMVTREASGEDGYNEEVIRVEDGAVEPEWRAAESALKGAIPLHSKLHSEVNVKRADWIEEEYGSTEYQHLIQEKHPSSDQPGKIKEDSDEDIKQNSDNESASAASSFPHPHTKKKESISRRRLELKETRTTRNHLLLLATLTTTITYQVRMNPPGVVGPNDHQGGSPILLTTHPWRFKVFLYSNTFALVASIFLIAMLLSHKLRMRILQAVMIIDLLSLVLAYVAGGSRDVPTALGVITVAVGILAYIPIHMVFFTLEHSEKEEEHSEKRKLLLLPFILAASITYQAGLTPPGILATNYPRGSALQVSGSAPWYDVFFYCNATTFMSSIAATILLVNPNLYKFSIQCNLLYVLAVADMFGLVGAYAAGSSRHMRTWVVVIVLFVLVWWLLSAVWLLNKKPTREEGLGLGKNEASTECTYQSEEEDKSMKKKRKILLLLAILATSITYQDGLAPRGFFATNYPRNYTVFFYCNATSFMSSIAAIILLFNPNLYKFSIQCNLLYVLAVADMFGIVGTYAARTSPHMRTWVVVIGVFVFVFWLLAVCLPSKKPTREEGLGLGKNEASTECTSGEEEDLSSAVRNQPNTPSNKEEGQSDEKKTRNYMMTMGILVASVTFQAAGVWPDSTNGHAAGDPVLRDSGKRWYGLFFDSNLVLFRTAVLVILLLLLEEQIDLRRLGVGNLLVRLRARLRLAALHCHARVTDLML